MGLGLGIRDMAFDRLHRPAGEVAHESDGPFGIRRVSMTGPRRIAPDSDDQRELQRVLADAGEDRRIGRPHGGAQFLRQLDAQVGEASLRLLRHRYDCGIDGGAGAGRLARQIALLKHHHPLRYAAARG